MHHVKRNAVHAALILLLLFAAAGCRTVAKATGRFALGTLTSGGNPIAGAQNAALGATLDIATDPKGELEANQQPQIITLYSEADGLQKILPWKKGITVYTARRTANLQPRPGPCTIERGDESLAGEAQTLLEPGDVLRFRKQ